MSRLVFDGNRITNRPRSNVIEGHIKQLQQLAWEKFYPTSGKAKVAEKANDSDHFAAILYHERFSEFLERQYVREEFVRAVRQIIDKRFGHIDKKRRTYVHWKDEKTDEELLAHLSVHLLPRHILGMGIPTYDIDYCNNTGAMKSLSQFATVVKEALDSLDPSGPLECVIAESFLRTLVYLRNLGVNFAISQERVDMGNWHKLELSKFEKREAESFAEDLAEFGKPNVRITIC